MALKTLRRSIFLFALAVVSSASAQITFTFNYTPSTTQYGLTASQPAQWTWTVNSDPQANLAVGTNWGSNISWEFSGQGAVQLWSGISGAGLGGTFDPAKIGFSAFALENSGRNLLLIDAVSSQSLGLTFNGYAVSGLRMYARPAGLTPSMSPPSTAFATYLHDYFGDYSISDTASTILIFKTIGGGDIYLANAGLTGLSVANTAVPEPSACAAIFGACALALVAWRRRQKSRPAPWPRSPASGRSQPAHTGRSPPLCGRKL